MQHITKGKPLNVHDIKEDIREKKANVSAMTGMTKA